MATVGRPRLIAISEIKADPELQARCNISQDAVADYAEAIERDERLPPVTVFWDGKTHWLADGFHRVAAHERVGRTHVSCQVQDGSRDDAAWYALGANKPNGMRLNNADKARAVSLALRLHPERSNRLIALHIGVSDHTVARRRAELEPGAPNAHVVKRVGNDGKSYRYAAEPPPVVEDPHDDDDMPPVVDGEGNDQPSAPEESSPATDRFGQPLSAELAELFGREPELVALCTQISKLKGQVLARIEAEDPLYRWIVPTQFAADCTNVRRQLAATKPYAICPYCGGGGCRACRDTGAINEENFKSAPEEIRERRLTG